MGSLPIAIVTSLPPRRFPGRKGPGSARLVVRLWLPAVVHEGMELSERDVEPGPVQGEAAGALALGDPGEGAEMLEGLLHAEVLEIGRAHV